MSFFQEINQALQNTTLFSIFFFVFGACLGSFFNVVALRYPIMMDKENASDIKDWMAEKNIAHPSELDKFTQEFNLSYPSSHCYSCKNPLKWYHNIPILSYLFLRGKCGFCATRISVQYPIVEFFAGVIMMMSYRHYFPQQGLEVFCLAAFFFIITYLLLVIDMKTMFLPDTLNYILLWTGLAAMTASWSIMPITLTDAVWGAIVGYGILWIMATVGRKLKGVEVMGGGDLKLLAALGAFTGVPGVVFTLFASPFIGIFSWVYVKLSKAEQPQVPYGPALILTNWIYIFYGQDILKLLGLTF